MIESHQISVCISKLREIQFSLVRPQSIIATQQVATLFFFIADIRVGAFEIIVTIVFIHCSVYHFSSPFLALSSCFMTCALRT